MTLEATRPTRSRAAPGTTAKTQTANEYVRAWVEECARLCKPDKIVWCDGSAGEKQRLIDQGVQDGTFIPLNQEKLPGCYLHRSNQNDVARSEHLTFICGPNEDLAGPTNNFMESKQAYAKLRGLFDGCMRGRTMYVVPFIMGPLGSPLAKVGVELTDSIYVVVNMGIMTRMGTVAWEQLAALKSGAQWSIATAREYLSFQKSDPWADYWSGRQTLTQPMKRLGHEPAPARADVTRARVSR